DLKQKLSKKLHQHPEPTAKTISAAAAETSGEKTEKKGTADILLSGAHGSSAPLGGRESASEERFIYEHDKELLDKLKKKK
ncbi:MAG: hypothetical protein SGCHY_003666, partial [Lobulomycetales sp.]